MRTKTTKLRRHWYGMSAGAAISSYSAGANRPEEREFYLRLAHREGWDTRETDSQLRGALFERAILGRPKVSPAVTQLHLDAEAVFKDSYLVDFLGLPEAHSEQELQTAIIVNLKRFLLELGRDFAFVGEQYLLPVGGQDFRLDLLFYGVRVEPCRLSRPYRGIPDPFTR